MMQNVPYLVTVLHTVKMIASCIIFDCCHFGRHEMPVAAWPIEILANTDDFLVINKPSSIPIHPCGRYRFNSILYILAKEKGFRNIRGNIL